jgi:hypothetical protein
MNRKEGLAQAAEVGGGAHQCAVGLTLCVGVLANWPQSENG